MKYLILLTNFAYLTFYCNKNLKIFNSTLKMNLLLLCNIWFFINLIINLFCTINEINYVKIYISGLILPKLCL